MNIAEGISGDPVVGANTVPALLPGRVQVSGHGRDGYHFAWGMGLRIQNGFRLN